MKPVQYQARLSCPHCGTESVMTMPEDHCLFFHECEACHQLLRPRKGDCCVFCSYADIPCPPVQQDKNCC